MQKIINIPTEYRRLFDDDWREAAVHGGRYSLKSHTVARFLLIRAREMKTRVACFREFQSSIAESSHQLLCELINEYELNDFEITNNSIINKINGSDFLFKGLWNNEQSIKSIEGIDIAWVEEAQTVSKSSLEVLTPTVRKPNSKIIYTYNRLLEEDPIHHRLVLEGRPNTLIINCNYDIAIKYGMIPDVILTEIEDDKRNRPGLYRHKWLGEPHVSGRKIYKDWAIIDEIPHEARLERYGLDFGYSCVSGETMISTNKGDRRIDKIREGDYVLTRKGYKKVLSADKKGIREVHSVDFGLDKRIIITGDHRVFTKDEWKEVNNLSNQETICVLKQNLEEEHTKDTLKGNTQTIFTGKEKRTEDLNKEFCTGIFTKNNMEKSRMDFVFTILIKIHSITIQKILSLFQAVNMARYISRTIWGELTKKECKRYGQEFVSQKKTGKKGEGSQSKPLKERLKSVLSVAKKLNQQTHIKNSVEQYVEKRQTQETASENIFVNNVERNSQHRHTIKEIPVLKNVQISSQLLKEKVEVFDLTIEDEHEFFANGVLIHNCDPTVIVAMYYYNGGFIFDEICHQKGLSNKQIADIIIGQETNKLVIADSAEPKSIDEIKSYGVLMLGVKKGKDSVKQGIQLVQDQPISVTKRSINTIKCYRNYLWKADKEGKILNEPEHQFSDPMDAIRYSFDGYRIKNLITKVVDDFKPRKSKTTGYSLRAA